MEHAMQTILIRYERLPEYCSACGRVGHGVRYCDDKTVDKTKKTFGVWLKAAKTMEYRRSRSTGNPREGSRSTSPTSSNHSRSKGIDNLDPAIAIPSMNQQQNEHEGGRGEASLPREVEENTYLISYNDGGDERESVMRERQKDVTKSDTILYNRDAERRNSLQQYLTKVSPKASPRKKKKNEGKGWKRRARERLSSCEMIERGDGGEEKGVLTGFKREGSMAEVEEQNFKRKQVCTREMPIGDIEMTAEAASQPRRTP